MICVAMPSKAVICVVLRLGCLSLLSGGSAFPTSHTTISSNNNHKLKLPLQFIQSPRKIRTPNHDVSSILYRRPGSFVSLTGQGRLTATTSTNVDNTCIPLLNFRDNNGTIDYIDRLDDAIMGGISTSTVRQPTATKYAIWNGVCRTDGGGFCGFRTNPFTVPFLVSSSIDVEGGGLYIKCRLVSDNEPQRRVWKLSTRTKPDRGELLYQAPFEILPSHRKSGATATSIYDDTTNVEDIEWQIIYVPFDNFRLVRGPQVVTNGPPLNVSAGIYQLGMTMSQFKFAAASTSDSDSKNTTRVEKTLPNFRDGYFELHIEEMGVYSPSNSSSAVATVQPETAATFSVLSKVEAKQQRSILIKVLFVVARVLFFSEQSQRRKSAMRILQSKYDMTRYQAIVWGFQRRRTASKHDALRLFRRTVSSLFETLSILSIDAIRSILSLSFKIVLLYPIRAIARLLACIKPKKTKTMDAR